MFTKFSRMRGMPSPKVADSKIRCIIMADTKKRGKLNVIKISTLSPRSRNWKIKAKVIESLTPNEQQKTYRNKNGTGRKCMYLLGDDSAKIKLKSFDEHAERLESLQINEEYYISGVELQLSNKKYHSYNKYELIVNEDTVIEPVDGGPSPFTSVQVGEKDTKKKKIQLTPIPLKQVHEDSKPEKHFDVMGIMKKSSMPEFKQYKNSTFYWKKISLIDTTGEISMKVSAHLQKDLKKVTALKNQVIGFVGCVWKDCDKECIFAKLDNLYEEKDLLGNLKVKVQNLKEWWSTQQKRSTRKRPAPSEKKSLLESAVSDPVQDPEIVPSKKMKIESNKSLTRSKAKSMTLLRPTTGHLFSKGVDNQKEVLPSIVRAEVSKSVGLIHIGGTGKGTGFRVGEKYIVTCEHVIKDVISAQHFIDSGRASIEFGKTSYNKKADPSQIFSIIDLMHLDKEYDFAVLELGTHASGVPFPPALTCFGMVCCTEVHLVGHPDNKHMMEDSVMPYWLPEHSEKILPDLKKCGDWSKDTFPDGKDHYEELCHLPRKIMFHTTFNHGASGSPGVVIKDEKPCVVLMLRGGVPGCIYYDGQFPEYAPKVKDDMRVEYGYAMQDIYEKMRNSSLEKDRDLASEIFKTWKC